VNQVRGEMPDDSRISARTVLREGGPDSAALVCDIVLTGAKSGKVLNIIGLRFQKAEAPRRSVEQRVSGWLYTTAWVDLEIPPVGAEGGEWRIVGTGADAEAIAGALRARGRTAVVQTSAERLDDGASVAGIVLVASPARQLDADSDINAELRRSLEPLLRLAHHAAGQPTHGRICVVTRGACAGDDEATITNPVATAAWGLGQTIAVEMPGWGCRRIDLEADAPHAPDAIADAILMNGAEDRLLLRKGRWRAARLVRVEGEPRKVRPAPDYRLDIAERGQQGALTLAPHTLEPLRADAVRIRVEATGLNFRDVLNALGMYPGDAGPLGNECAGTVEAVGASVRGLEPGDRVVAITPRGFCSRVDAPALLAVRVPDGIPSGAAATIPIAFLTADWALNELAHMRAGERVLIHAGAGGVGMAAVQLAARAGAEIHATVGSRRKREVLRRMGVRHIYDSRSLSFRDEILHNTNGEGVHIVLNSLADDFIPASLDVLRQDGRFLEIGKTGVWDAERVRTVRPDADYHVIYLGEACEQDPVRVRERFVGLMESFASGELQPLPVRRFMVDDAAAAFRFMAQARHIGKVVLFDSTEAADAPDDGAVWITGGLGGIGLVIAADLARRGYRKLALSGRSDPTPEAGTRLQEIRDLGAEVLLVRCDVSHRSHVLRARETIEERGWSIRHVLHSAGVLDDGTLPSLTWPRFETVLAPKALGAWNLHLVTADLPLESFVLFSAGAALLGSPGQANYAAANAFLDGLAELRRAIGLPAQSIAWGAWAEVGMAARAGLDWSSRGMDTIDLEGGAAALNRLRREADVSAAVLPMDWRRLFGSLPEGLVPGLLQDLHAEVMGEPGQGAGLSESDDVCLKPGELALLTPDERVARLGEYIRATLGRVLGIRPEQLGMETEIGYLGFDSLMATEVRNRIEADLNVLIPTRHLLDSPSASRLALEISTRMDAGVSGNGSGTPVAWTEGEI
jgi:NADPH:quinone reductase-like Zn-dependent oxidoreductase